MGAIQKIRNHSVVLVVAIAIGLFAFIMPWNEVMNLLNARKDKAFKVEGEVIKTGEYAARLEMLEQLYPDNQDPNAPNRAYQAAQRKESAFESIITEKLLQTECDILGLAVSKEELENLTSVTSLNNYFNLSPVLLNSPVFMGENRQFDVNRYNQFVAALREPLSTNQETRSNQDRLHKLWSYLEGQVKVYALNEKYTALVGRSILANNAEINQYINNAKYDSDLEYVKLDYSTISDSEVKVSDDEIKKLYDERKKDFLSKNEMREVSYFIKQIRPSEADEKATELEITKVKEDIIDAKSKEEVISLINESSNVKFQNIFLPAEDLQIPEVIKFANEAKVGESSDILRGDRRYTFYTLVDKVNEPKSVNLQIVPIIDAPNVATAKADSLLAVIKGGKKIEDVYKEVFAQDPEPLKGMDLNTIQIAQISPNPEKMFKANRGDVFVEQLMLQQGFFVPCIIKVADRGEIIPKVKVGVVDMTVSVSDDTSRKISNEINRFVADNKTNVKDFNDIATKAGYAVVENALFEPGTPYVEGIEGTREVVKWAFNEDNATKELGRFETPEAYVVAVVNNKYPAGFIPYTQSAVNQQLKNYIIIEKKAEMLKEKLVAYAGKPLADIAEKESLSLENSNYVNFNTTSVDYPINVWAKAGKTGQESTPLAGNAGVYVFKTVDQKENPIVLTNEEAKIELNNLYRNINSPLLPLFDKANIIDMRNLYF